MAHTEQSAKQTVVKVTSLWAVANLHLEPGDVLVITRPELEEQEAVRIREVVRAVLSEAGLHNPVLVVPYGTDLQKLSAPALKAMPAWGIAKADAGDWQHQT